VSCWCSKNFRFLAEHGSSQWIPATWEAEIRRMFWGWPRQKISKTLISISNLGVLAHACGPGFTGSHR
jgi:hypothetical protein